MSVVPFGAERIEADPLTSGSSAAQTLPNSTAMNTSNDPTETQPRLSIYGDNDGRTLTGVLEDRPEGVETPLREVMSPSAQDSTWMMTEESRERRYATESCVIGAVEVCKCARGPDGVVLERTDRVTFWIADQTDDHDEGH